MNGNNLSRFFLVVLSALFITGCATQKGNFGVKLAENFWQNQEHDITIAKTKYTAGNISEEVLSSYDQLPAKFASKLKQRNILVKVHPNDLYLNNQDNVFAMHTDSDKLLLINLRGAGFSKDNPKEAYCIFEGKLIDQKNKKILWHHVADIEEISVHGSSVDALSMAVAASQEEIIDSFFSGH